MKFIRIGSEPGFVNLANLNIKLGLINYTLLGLIEHHGVFIDSGHYVSYIRQSNKWYHCDDKHITETNLLTLSNNVYLMFYAKKVDLGT